MKKIISLYKPYMIRPILYRSVTKASIALAAVLVWDRFINSGHLSALRDASLTAAVLLFLAAWISYLRLDGIRLRYLKEEKTKKKRRSTSDLVDYVDEHIVTFDELNDDERLAAGMLSSLLPGLLFLAAALAAAVL